MPARSRLRIARSECSPGEYRLLIKRISPEVTSLSGGGDDEGHFDRMRGFHPEGGGCHRIISDHRALLEGLVFAIRLKSDQVVFAQGNVL